MDISRHFKSLNGLRPIRLTYALYHLKKALPDRNSTVQYFDNKKIPIYEKHRWKYDCLAGSLFNIHETFPSGFLTVK